MAEVINKLYQSVYPSATFFRPQFDMKRGRYELETTARVIQERCGGKTIFLLSEYFLANEVCQFAVNFAAAVCRGAGVGNLIPFHLSPNNEHVPPVLRGIAGIRWFRKEVRKFAWHMVTETILVHELQQSELESVLQRINELIQSQPSQFMSDPQYDEGTDPPGAPIHIQEPEGMEEILRRQHRCIPPLPSSELEDSNSRASSSSIKTVVKRAVNRLKQKLSRSKKSHVNNSTTNNSIDNDSNSTANLINENESRSDLNEVPEGAELAVDVLEDLSHVTLAVDGESRARDLPLDGGELDNCCCSNDQLHKDNLLASITCNENKQGIDNSAVESIPMNALPSVQSESNNPSETLLNSLNGYTVQTDQTLPEGVPRGTPTQNENLNNIFGESSETIHSDTLNGLGNSLSSSKREPMEHEEEDTGN